ncbi:MAG: transferrin receptor-like dimerization domain-containing protein, partial [Pricia sp.]
HREELQQKAVAYINTDGNGRGFLSAGGSHSLQHMVGEVAEAVEDPQTGVSVKERKIASQLVEDGSEDFELYAVGSGSDYSPFIQHAGIASLNLGFGGENEGGEYHTIYDTYPHYKRFKDPGFAYGVALANTAGRIVLRLANADVLPMEFEQWHKTVSGYLGEVMKETETMRDAVEKHNGKVDKNVFELAADPSKPFVKPEKKETVPYLDFAPVQNAMATLKTSIDKYKSADLSKLSPEKRKALNQKLMQAEQALTSEKGLPQRPWYKHQIYAPGFYTGYGVKTLPGVREAIEQKEWKEAQQQIQVLAETLGHFEEQITNMNNLF